MKSMKLISVLALIVVMFNNHGFSTNFYTQSGGTGQYANNSNWLGGAAGRPGSNTGYAKYGGPTNDTIFINHALSTTSNFEFGGQYVVVVIGSGGSLSINTTKNFNLNSSKIIVNGGTLNVSNNFTTSNPSPITIRNNGFINVTNNMTINNTTLTIEEGSTLTVGGAFSTSNTSGSMINLSGTMNVGKGMSMIAGTWNVNSSGTLNVTGNLVNDSGGTVFNVSGDIAVSGNTSFHSGNFNINSGGTYTSSGAGQVLFGAANITNDGVMNFPNATSQNKYGGSFDCDGSSGNGTVGFGAGSFCGSCNGGSARCVDNGVPLPIELNYFTASIVNDLFVFSWETLSEKNNDYFTIEYSFDLKVFDELLEEDGAGTSLSPISYERTDDVVAFENVIYFRLKQTDFDGQFSYSQIEAVSSSALKITELGVYPNPTEGRSLIKLAEVNTSPLEVFVLSSSTLQILDVFQIENGEAILDLPDYENGVYFLKIENRSTVYKLVIQK